MRTFILEQMDARKNLKIGSFSEKLKIFYIIIGLTTIFRILEKV